MKTRFLLTQTIVLLTTVLLTLSAGAAEDNSSVVQRISDTSTLRVGMTGGQAPFNVINREGQFIGLDVDLAKLLAKSMGVKLEIIEMPFADLIPSLEDHKIDLVMSGMTANLPRNMRVPFVGPYFVSGKSILTKSDTMAKIQETGEINVENLRIAALRGSTSEEFVKKNLNKATLTTTVDHAAAVQLLLDGKVDAVVADGPVCALSILRYPDAGLTTLRKPLTIEAIGIGIAPGDPLLVNLVQNYMTALQATGALEAAQKKWFESGGWLIQLP